MSIRIIYHPQESRSRTYESGGLRIHNKRSIQTFPKWRSIFYQFQPCLPEPERLFSDTKITLQDRRNRLGIGVIEAIECIRSWSNSHKVAWVDEVGVALDTAIIGEDGGRKGV